MPDSDIKSGGGAVVEGNIGTEGGDFVNRDKTTDNRRREQNARSEAQQTMRNDVHFNNADNAFLFQEILRLSEKIDGLPEKVVTLTGRVTSLEKVEVNVKPGNGEVTIKTKATDDDFNIPQRTVVLIILIMVVVVAVVVGWLVWRVNYG